MRPTQPKFVLLRDGSMARRGASVVATWLAATLCLPRSANADDAATIKRRLDIYEQQARELGTNLPTPTLAFGDRADGPKQLVDAQLAFRVGNFDEAALALYEIVGRGKSPDYDAALYYLGETLLQKGDRNAARAVFVQHETDVGSASPHHAHVLTRLIEVYLAAGDVEPAATRLRTLEAYAGRDQVAVDYLRGKVAFARGAHAEALAAFAAVPRTSAFGLRALYFAGACHVAKQELEKATTVFTEATAAKPQTSADRRVVELAQLALGRVYYERDQPTRSIAAYTAVHRKSDLFSDAVFEAAWVYVKGKQFDKALAALEMLSGHDETAPATSGVRILEGNLRIRKAQLLRSALVEGRDTVGDPEDEYLRAHALFTRTRDQYAPSHAELMRVLGGTVDAGRIVAQLAGEEQSDGMTMLPELATVWIRQEPSIAGVIELEDDLAEVGRNVRASEKTVRRLEVMLAQPHGASAFPSLASRRVQGYDVVEQVIKLRADAGNQLATLVSDPAAKQATEARAALELTFAGLPHGTLLPSERLTKAREEYDALDTALMEADAAIGEAAAATVANRMYHRAQLKASGGAAPAASTTGPAGEASATPVAPPSPDAVLNEVTAELGAMRDELIALREDAEYGRDEAGVVDATTVQAAAVRGQLIAALDAEGTAYASAIGGNSEAIQLLALHNQAGQVLKTALASVATVDSAVDGSLGQVRTALDGAKLELATQRNELTTLKAESVAQNGEALRKGVAAVKAKLYDIVVRSDVGIIDVLWSQKEDVDADMKRLQLERTREVRHIRDEFRDVLDAVAPAAAAGAPKPATPASPTAPATTPAASPVPAPAGGGQK